MSNWADLTNGKRIKHLRGSGLAQQGLADAAGLSLALVQKAEQDRGELSIGSLLKLAHALNTDVSVILGQQAPRRGMDQGTRAAVRRLSDAVHDSALGAWQTVEEPSTLAELSIAPSTSPRSRTRRTAQGPGAQGGRRTGGRRRRAGVQCPDQRTARGRGLEIRVPEPHP
ncbi:transcriptional regulator with XRE-family HTH domain [Streptomyces albaduncus]|uniref:Transcriptional regulator with XRE-family HTH domain n=1 Tax=Streptomyces griseoloalbus TaxID=67303 RepID=A0A7W8BI73_9ACTN|nr:transcriptional regulator with XRE-family HTH domain [Streptomyces albaduncus]